MIRLRPSKERGYFDHGWLKTYHTFSFADYRDPQHQHFQNLRVINEDYVAGGQGFGTHFHRDMEIITYIIEGELEHKDSMGNGSIIKSGDVQYMAAGSGVQHSEFNPSATHTVHLLQIWIFPNARSLKPTYGQQHYDRQSKINQLKLIVTGTRNANLITINQDANLYASVLEAGKNVTHAFSPGRHGWVQLISGELEINGVTLRAGDGAALSHESQASFKALKESEFLFFDLASA